MVKHIHNIVADDFSRLNERVITELHSSVPLIESIGHYIVDAGGKRMRPTLVLLCARALGYDDDKHIDLATVIEFIHTATLLHDDVVDVSEMRRGRLTANQRWDNPSSVLVGDFIYSRAFELMVRIGDMDIMEVMASTTNQISEGEVLQLLTQRNPEATESDYQAVITHKTAILFAAACRTAGILAGSNNQTLEALHTFGLETGKAFQLIDDVLDYTGNAEELGKNIGDDLSEGKPTLPLIYTMSHGTEQNRELIAHAITKGGLEHLNEIVDAVQSSGALDYTRDMARNCQEKALCALNTLPANTYTDGLAMVVESAVNRSC